MGGMEPSLDLNEITLLGLIATLIGSQTVVVKWLMSRSDRLVTELTKAVASFQRFETLEDEVHTKIIDSLAKLATTQERILTVLTEMREGAKQ